MKSVAVEETAMEFCWRTQNDQRDEEFERYLRESPRNKKKIGYIGDLDMAIIYHFGQKWPRKQSTSLFIDNQSCCGKNSLGRY